MVSASAKANVFTFVNVSKASNNSKSDVIKDEKNNDFETTLQNKKNTFKTDDDVKSTKREDPSIKKEKAITKDQPEDIDNLKSEDVKLESIENMSTVMMDIKLNIVNAEKEVISNELGISVTELESNMSQLGINDEMLMDKESLKNLFMKVNGIETPSILITDGEITKEFKNFINNVELFLKDPEKYLADNNILFNDEEKVLILEPNNDDQENIKITTNEQEELTGIKTTDVKRDEDISLKDVNEKEADGLNTKVEVNQFGNEKNSEEYSGTKEKNDDKSSVLSDKMNTISMNKTFTENLKEILVEKTGITQSESIMEQISNQIKLNVRPDFTSLEMQLYPEHLGKVGIQIVSKEGMLTAQIIAENESAKKVIESQMATLKESFSNSGIKVENVEVTLASHSFENNNMNESERDEHSGNKKKTSKINLEDFMDEEDLENEQIIMDYGNTVSYSV